MSTSLTFITEADLAKLKAINGKDTTYTDSRAPGLRVRVSARTGQRTFVLEYRRPGTETQKCSPTKKTLKGITSLKEARLRAAELKSALGQGIDLYAPPTPPLMPPEKTTIRRLADLYRSIKKPSAADWRSIERAILPTFGDMDIIEIRTHHVSTWHSGFAHSTLNTFFSIHTKWPTFAYMPFLLRHLRTISSSTSLENGRG